MTKSLDEWLYTPHSCSIPIHPSQLSLCHLLFMECILPENHEFIEANSVSFPRTHVFLQQHINVIIDLFHIWSDSLTFAHEYHLQVQVALELSNWNFTPYNMCILALECLFIWRVNYINELRQLLSRNHLLLKLIYHHNNYLLVISICKNICFSVWFSSADNPSIQYFSSSLR